MGAQVFREAVELVVANAFFRVDEHWAGQRIGRETVERIVSKQNAIFVADVKRFQAMAAGPIAGRRFLVSGMAVARRFHRGTDEFSNFRRNGNYSQVGHKYSS
jgi:hypothetical protein